MAQAHTLEAALTAQGHEVEIVPIRTSGDQGHREVLGAFVKEIQLALLADEVDVALHCLKDLPTTPVPGLTLSAYLEREDARETLIVRAGEPERLAKGSVVGTGSLRRTSQLSATRPDLAFKPLVGNVDTRMRKLMVGEYDAIVLAIAGLKRLGLLDGWDSSDYSSLRVAPKSTRTLVPAAGQAVLVLETRDEDAASREGVRALHDEATEQAALAERTFLHSFGGGCSLPVGAFAERIHENLVLFTWVSMPDGSLPIRASAWGPPADAEKIGLEAVRQARESDHWTAFEAWLSQRAEAA